MIESRLTIQNHVVVNSVSVVDGKKYDNSHADRNRMMSISDEICRDHGLSVIEKPKGRTKQYGEWLADKSDRSTQRDEIRNAIDRAVSQTWNFRDFCRVIENDGYVLEPRGSFLRMEKMQLDADVAKLKLQKASHLSQRYMLEDRIIKNFPRQIKEKEERLAGYDADIVTAEQNTHKDEKGFSSMVLSGETYTVKADAGKKILDICKSRSTPEPKPIGEYRGFKMELGFDVAGHEFFIDFKGVLTHPVSLGQDANGIITRLDNVIDSLPTRRQNCADQLAEIHRQLENAKEEVAKPFSREEELTVKSKRLDELNVELNMDRRENEIADEENEQEEDGGETEKETEKGTEEKKPKCR